MLQTSITYGFNVTLVEVSDELATKAKSKIIQNIERLATKKHSDNQNEKLAFIKSISDRLTVTSDLKGSVKAADLVIEAIVETLAAKHAMFATIDTVRKSIYFFFDEAQITFIINLGSSS